MDILRYIKGYVVFEARGGFPERFMNLCRMRCIDIRNAEIDSEGIRAQINPKDFRKLRGAARNCGVSIRIKRKRGLPFFLRQRRNRIGLFLGIIFCGILMTFLNNFVWCIDAVGSERFTSEQIIAVGEKYGLRVGIFVPAFDEVKAARDIVTDFAGEIEWGAINIKGSKAVIEVRDFTDNLGPYSGDEPCNLISDTDGVILSVEAQKGQSQVKSGSAVAKGEVLISGAVETQNLTTYFVHAKGKVTALTKHELSSQEKIESKKLKYIDSHSFYTLNIMGLSIPLGFYKTDLPHHVFTYERFIESDGQRLPFSFSKTTVAEYSEENCSPEEISVLAVAEYSGKELSSLANTRILSEKVKISANSKGIKLAGEYDCIDFIGIEQPIVIENS